MNLVVNVVLGPCSLVQVRCYNICIYQDTDPSIPRTLIINGLLHGFATHVICCLLQYM